MIPTGKINEHVSVYRCPGYKTWVCRDFYIADKRFVFCGNCDSRMEYPAGGSTKCEKCGTLFLHDAKGGFWYYLDAGYEYDKSICPDCDRKGCPNHENLQGFQFCESCRIEFRWQLRTQNSDLICIKFPYKRGKYIMSKESMNAKYATPDPFNVKNDPVDAARKQKILEVLDDFIIAKLDGLKFKRALDIGCGEGFITMNLPAIEIVAYDVSNVALSRIPLDSPLLPPRTISTCDDPANIQGKFDLILAAGVLVNDYDFMGILDLIEKHASGIVITCQTDKTEVEDVSLLRGRQIHYEEFPYRENKQRLRVFSYSEEFDELPDVAEVVDSIPDENELDLDVEDQFDNQMQVEDEPSDSENFSNF